MSLNSRLQLSSQTVPVSPEHLSGPQRICPAHPLSASFSSGGPAALPPATTGDTVSPIQVSSQCTSVKILFQNSIFHENILCIPVLAVTINADLTETYSILFNSLLFYPIVVLSDFTVHYSTNLF